MRQIKYMKVNELKLKHVWWSKANELPTIVDGKFKHVNNKISIVYLLENITDCFKLDLEWRRLEQLYYKI